MRVPAPRAMPTQTAKHLRDAARLRPSLLAGPAAVDGVWFAGEAAVLVISQDAGRCQFIHRSVQFGSAGIPCPLQHRWKKAKSV